MEKEREKSRERKKDGKESSSHVATFLFSRIFGGQQQTKWPPIAECNGNHTHTHTQT